jgi:hypothetical protein
MPYHIEIDCLIFVKKVMSVIDLYYFLPFRIIIFLLGFKSFVEQSWCLVSVLITPVSVLITPVSVLITPVPSWRADPGIKQSGREHFYPLTTYIFYRSKQKYSKEEGGKRNCLLSFDICCPLPHLRNIAVPQIKKTLKSVDWFTYSYLFYACAWKRRR